MAERALRLCIRTPQEVALDLVVRSARVSSDTGQVGLRPGTEAAALAVEPGLVLAEAPDGLRFAATAGGLLRCDGREAMLLTPFAVVGASAEAVRAALADTLHGANADLELRRLLQRLETGLLEELRVAAQGGGP